jgi:hypothetical protein
MSYYFFTKQCATTIWILFSIFLLFSVNAHKKNPAGTFAPNLTGISPRTYNIFDDSNSSLYTINTSTEMQSDWPSATSKYTLNGAKDQLCVTGTGLGSEMISVNSQHVQLLACYKFDGNAQDSKGTNHGTVNGATLTSDRFGKANSAYSFNGTSNYIAIPAASLAPAEYTYAAWVNTNTLNDYSQTILSIGWYGADQVLALSNTTGTTPNWNFSSYIYYAALPIPQILSTNNATAFQWHFVVATRTLNEIIYRWANSRHDFLHGPATTLCNAHCRSNWSKIKGRYSIF